MNLNSMLRVGNKGSTIDVIVTTREVGIARKISTREAYEVKPLKHDICWEIIKRSSEFEGTSNQKQFERIGLDIAKKCGGVPLAANALGCMLKSKDLSEWEKINNSDIWNETSKDSMLPSLKLSYQRMPPQLRICFSYCAVFPKGHNIVEDDLVHQWNALDFIEPSKGKEYINQLLGMSFLQVSKLPVKFKENVVRYTMHDLVHDLARLIMADELIVFDEKRNERAYKYCLYSLLKKYDRTMNLSNVLPSKLKVLRFSDSDKLDISSDAFSFAKRLRTLDFSECTSILLPSSIGPLKLMRYLVAPKMQNESLPKFITELPKLKYLNINGSSQISALPESIGNLGCLEYLDLSGCSAISKLPESFGDLKCMVHLNMSSCSGITELPDSLGNLTNLQHLELSGCWRLRAIPESLCGLTQLQYLDLSSCGIRLLPETIGSLVHLQYLNMSTCREITQLPESLMKLQTLLHLDLSFCSGLRGGSALGGLRGLTALRHLDMTGLSFTGEEELDVLGNLTSLKNISKIENNKYVFDFIIGTLTNLEHLHLSYNSDLARLPESICNLKKLHTLNIINCRNLKSIPESIGALGLKSLRLDNCSNELMDQASSLVHYSLTFPLFKVRADDANGCSNLHRLEDAHDVSHLNILCLENARCLDEANRVKLQEKHNLSTLALSWTLHVDRHLEDKDLLGQLLPPRGLKHMSLKGYSSTSFPAWLMDISYHLTNLVSIVLWHLPTCSNLPPVGQLAHLKELYLSSLNRIKKIDREFCGGKGAFRRLSKFYISFMEGLEEWSTTYSVENGVEEFMFPVLESLTISWCGRLRLKPRPPIFGECEINYSDQVISSLEEMGKISHPCSPSRGTKLVLGIESHQSMRILHHFPALQELKISGHRLKCLPESMRHLTSLQSLTLSLCDGIAALPEWLGDLSSLTRFNISGCHSIKSLPPCIQQLTKLQKLDISSNLELKEWCRSEENKMKLGHINNVVIDHIRIFPTKR